jgi:hypothetical protein
MDEVVDEVGSHPSVTLQPSIYIERERERERERKTTQIPLR